MDSLISMGEYFLLCRSPDGKRPQCVAGLQSEVFFIFEKGGKMLLKFTFLFGFNSTYYARRETFLST